MRSYFKSISITLIFALLFTIIPFSSFAEKTFASDTEQVTNQENYDQYTQNIIPNIINELKDKREQNVKHFLRDDGTIEACVYPNAVHYKDESNQWVDIDNTLVEQTELNGKPKIENKANSFKVKFAQSSSGEDMINVNLDEYHISWGIADALESSAEISTNNGLLNTLNGNDKWKVLTKTNSNIYYKNVLSDIDLQYSLVSQQVKEDIIIKKNNGVKSFVFNLKVKNLIPELSENNIEFYDSKDNTKLILKMPAPYMIDAKGETSNAIEVNLIKDDNGYTLKLIPDKTWLNEKDRMYPVVLDPTISIANSTANIDDAYVDKSNPTTNYGTNEHLRVGTNYMDPNLKYIAYVKFVLPTLPSAAYITNATYYNSFEYCEKNSLLCQINIHKVSDSWSETSVTWNNKPGFESQVKDYQLTDGSYNGTFVGKTWDITTITKDWYTYGGNYGLALENDIQSGYCIFASCEHPLQYGTWGSYYGPSINIVYINCDGLEQYWTYHSQSIGRSGTGYVNDSTGCLTLIHNDINMSGTRLPITLNHIYNSNNADVDSNIGKGWRLSLAQEIKPGNIYIDEDGTTHEFGCGSYNPTEQCYVYPDLSGIGLTLKQYPYNPTYPFKIVDKQNNKLVFKSNGYSACLLYQIIDHNNNTMTLSYDTDGVTLRTITDGAGRVVTLNYTNGKLSQVVDPSNRITYYAYTNNLLTSITYPDSVSTTYTYDANSNLTSVTRPDGYKISYTYFDASPYRIESVEESNTDSTLGQRLDLSYTASSTHFTDINDREEIFQYNNYGNTSCIKDNKGYAQFYDSLRGTNVNNKLSLASKLQKTIINYLMNHNMEGWDSYWTQYSWDGSTGTYSSESSIKYIGTKSLKIQKTNTLGGHSYYQQVSLEKGKTYTLSGYIKTSGISSGNNKGACLQVKYYDSAGTSVYANSPYITGTKDWERYEVKFTLPENSTSSNINAYIEIAGETGIAYFDALQLEEGNLANRYNLIENPDFTYGSGTPYNWSKSTDCDSSDTLVTLTDSDYPSGLGDQCFRIIGAINKNKILSSGVAGSFQINDRVTVGLWVKADAIPSSSGSCNVWVYNTSSSSNGVILEFNKSTSDWQYISGSFIINFPTDSVHIDINYNNKINSVYFDGIQIYKENFGDSYSYDSNGNLNANTNLALQNSQYYYNSSNDMTAYTSPRGYSSGFTYDTNHNLLTATSAESIVNSYSYDSYGNILTSRTRDTNNYVYIQTTSAYTTNGNYLSTVTDPSGNTVTYNFNQTKGTLDSLTDAKSKTTSYTYDTNLDRLIGVSKTVGGQQVSNSYSYTDDRISQITHNGFNYNFDYDSLGNPTEVSVGSQSLVTNAYESRTSKMLSSTYGNGQVISYDYDDLDRVINKKYNGNIKYSYVYNADGNVGYFEDLVNSLSYRYIFDTATRLSKVTDSNGNSTAYAYDNESNKTSVIEKINGTTYTTSYEYDKDNKPKKVTATNNAYSSNTYDVVGRLSSTAVSTGSFQYNTTYSYLAGVSGSTTNRLGTITNNGTGITYTYDTNGNISVITSGDCRSEVFYNELNELVRENRDAGSSWTALANMPTGRAFTGGASVDNKIYVIGGACNSGYINTVQEYDTITDSWSTKASISCAKGMMATSTAGGKVYIFGGSNDSTIYNTTEEYNPSANTWTTRALMPTARTQAAAATYNGKIYVIGGIREGVYLSTVEEYDPSTNTWVTKASMPTARRELSVVCLNNKIYAIGGHNSSGALNTVEEYNPSTNTWTSKASLLTGRYFHSSAVLEGKIYTFGGISSTYLSSVEVYDPNTNTWNYSLDMQATRYGQTAVVVGNNIYLIGGYRSNYLNNTDKFSKMPGSCTVTYSYDIGGNITSKIEYPYTTGTPSNPTKTYNYTYNSVWKDKLVIYDGKSITYDQIGNPLTYDGWTYTWGMGRQLASMSKTGQSLAFKYNDSGIRTQKVYNSVTTNYHLVGDRVTFENNGTDSIYYTYDANGKLFCMSLNGTMYYYIRNGQGDIIGLFDNAGTQVVSYTYDTWGKLISVTGTLASTVGVKNPYRYRGYRYDTETGLYYCQSRYYNPEWGRWINADSITGVQGLLLSHNTFAYCLNNPVNDEDPSGYLAWAVIGAIVGAVIGGVAGAVISYKTTGKVSAAAVIGGAVGGALILSGVGAVISAVSSSAAATTAVTTGGTVLYQATSNSTAQKVMQTGQLLGSKAEAGRVFAFIQQPTLKQVAQSGAKSMEAVIRFETKASFVVDTTVQKGLQTVARVSARPGPITVTNVQNVGFRK